MAMALDVASWLLLVTGAVVSMIGGVGILRMPDFYTRMHAASVTETAGMMLIMAGLLLQVPDWTVAVRLVLITGFLIFTSPTAGHALAYWAVSDGHQPLLAKADEATR